MEVQDTVGRREGEHLSIYLSIDPLLIYLSVVYRMVEVLDTMCNEEGEHLSTLLFILLTVIFIYLSILRGEIKV